MKQSTFTQTQVACVINQAEDGASIVEVCRKAGIAEVTAFISGKKYASSVTSEMYRLMLIKNYKTERERLVKGLSLDKAMLQHIITRNACFTLPVQ